jgi:hypothetical protein
VLSGSEEARLGAVAVLSSVPVDRGAIVDLGGGSLQVTRVRAGRIARVASVPLGTLRTTLHFLKHDPPRASEIRALRRETRDRLLGVLPRAEDGDMLIGLGGSLRALGRIFRQAKDRRGASLRGLRLRREEVASLRTRLQPLSVRQRRRIRGLKAERADIILAGAVVIEELYAASGAGVQIDLIVRGICCLRPGVPGLSEGIRVISIVDRFLEHARLFYFENGDAPEYLLASADWMPRNLDRRVEVAFPVLEPALQAELRTILDVQLADTVKARLLRSDGSSQRITAAPASSLRSQERLYELARTPRTT